MGDRTSTVPPLFLDSAREILERLSEVTGPAWRMRQEAAELLELFKLWEQMPASATERAEAVRRLLDLHRRAMDFLIKNRAG